MKTRAVRGWRCAACVGAGLVLFGAPAARADLIPVFQSRVIGVGGSIRQLDPDTGDVIDEQSFSDSATAPDFATFHDGRGIALRLGDSSVDGFAAQTSTIAPYRVAFSGLADLNADVLADFEEAQGSSITSFDLLFDVAETEVWRLTAFISANGSGFADLTLSGPDGILVEVSRDTGNFDDFFTLAPGHYELSASARASGFAFPFQPRSGRADFSFTFVTPEPATGALLTAGLTALARSRRDRSTVRSR
jgi:hypothetical protein